LTDQTLLLFYIIPRQRIYCYITLNVFIFPICLCKRSRSLFLYMDRPGTCIVLDKKYNIANTSCHFGSYGSIWTGPSPKKYMDLRSFGPYNIFLVMDRSIYCHMTLSAMNYLLYIYIYTFIYCHMTLSAMNYFLYIYIHQVRKLWIIMLLPKTEP
jgi:hypothetical protein